MNSTETTPSIAVLIDARTHSAALPGAPLIPLGGRPTIDHVVRRLEGLLGLDSFVVVTDDSGMRDVIAETCEFFVSTPVDLQIEEAEINEVALRLAQNHELVIWAAGDSPLVSRPWIELALAAAMSSAEGLALPDRAQTGLVAGGGARIYGRDALLRGALGPAPRPIYPRAPESLRSNWSLRLRSPEDLGRLSLIFDSFHDSSALLQADTAIACLNRLAARSPEVVVSARWTG